MRIDDCDGDDGLAVDPCALTPFVRERAGRRADRLRFGELLRKAGRDPVRIADARFILRLIGREIEAAGLAPGQSPDQPVAGFDELVAATPDVRRFGCDLSRLGEQPFARNLAAEIREIRTGAGVDRLCVRLRRCVLPELHISVWVVRYHLRQGPSIGERGHGRACCKVDANSRDISPSADRG